MDFPRTQTHFTLRVAAAVFSFWSLASITFGQGNSLEDQPYKPSASVVKGTVAALSDPSEAVRTLAVRSLGDWRQADAAAEIGKLLGPETPVAVRIEAFRFFSRLGPQALPALGEILKYSGDPDPNIRAAVLNAIFDARASADHLGVIRSLLDDPRADVRIIAAKCLGQAGKAAVAHRQALLDVISSSGSSELKAAALNALVTVGGFTVAELDVVTPLMRDRDAEVRIEAWSLALKLATELKAANLIPDDKRAAVVAALIAQFNSESPEIKVAIIQDAGSDKATVDASVSALVNQIRTGSPEVRTAALRILGKAGAAALPHLPLILEQAKDADSIVRAAAIACLGSIGPDALKPNVTLIANSLRDDSETVRGEALLALPNCGESLRNFPYRVRDIYPTSSPEVRATLVKALPVIVRVIGMDEDAISRARAALTDASTDIRIAAAYVMSELGTKDGAALLPDLLALVKDPDPGVRGAAAIALRSFASDDAAKTQLRAALLPLLKDGDGEVRWATLDTFHELDPGKDAAVVAAIDARLKDEEASVRSAAVRALGAAGPVAKAYLPDIIAFFDDDPAVPPYAASQAVAEVSPLTPQEITSLLYPLYVYAELSPITRLTAHRASGGERDGQIIIRLLGQTRLTAREVVAPGESEHAIALLQDALKAPLLHEKLKAEINARLTELKNLH
ncbi:MAG TPA: HEAT repeat domain-containing protein [Chthoniobacter sp.]|nr:HEAT repeat domain-containing protein [Chthoniobacter sp.]